jgi:2-keto-4-pentenoate hydratase
MAPCKCASLNGARIIMVRAGNMQNEQLAQAAQRLREAYSGNAIAPLRDLIAADDLESSYAVQALNRDHWLSEGRKIVGRKIGLTAKSVQAQLGVDQPDFGILFDDMEIADGGTLEMAKVIQPKAEAEIALILSRDLPREPVTFETIGDYVAYAVPAIEIVDSRIADWKIAFADTVADNGSSAMFVLGDERKPLADLDLWSCGMVLEVNGETVSLGAGAACLGHPLKAAVWLANTLAAQNEPMRAGDVVLTGALGPMVNIQAGDHVRATVGGLGTVSFNVNG